MADSSDTEELKSMKCELKESLLKWHEEEKKRKGEQFPERQDY